MMPHHSETHAVQRTPKTGTDAMVVGKNTSSRPPDATAVTAMESRYRQVPAFPIRLHIAVIMAAFEAGPAIRNTMAAPGDAPMWMNDAASGIEAVEQT